MSRSFLTEMVEAAELPPLAREVEENGDPEVDSDKS